MRNQTAGTLKNAESMKTDANQLTNDITETAATLGDYKRQAGTDKARASDVRVSLHANSRLVGILSQMRNGRDHCVFNFEFPLGHEGVKGVKLSIISPIMCYGIIL